MITFLNGFLWDRQEDGVIIDVGGVGYKVYMAGPAMKGLPPQGEPLLIHVYHHIREDESSLFGFLDEGGRDFFMTLITVSGIGPRGALKIMDQAAFQDIAAAIAEGDLVFLSSLSGIGKKTAERLIVELREKVKEYAAAEGPREAEDKAMAEALEALRNLQFPVAHIRAALAEIIRDSVEKLTTEELIRRALRYMGKG
ncbi:Holliday junction branch migration protein RuvA [Candidatus Mcinerneyibacteriota bacterium]|nr:Holliday junction branch migration protein RuvA [Candidatus Mcinerneyibacteriota bacterium]